MISAREALISAAKERILLTDGAFGTEIQNWKLAEADYAGSLGLSHDQKGNTLPKMATALITAFLAAKMKDAKTSVALYYISSDVDGAKIVQQMGVRSNKAIVAMLATSCEPLSKDPQLVASMLQGAMAGISRRLLESGAPQKQFDTFCQELIFFACAYLQSCSA